jgi:hypothetical protein
MGSSSLEGITTGKELARAEKPLTAPFPEGALKFGLSIAESWENGRGNDAEDVDKRSS